MTDLTIDPAISSAMSELGIDQSSLDADEISTPEAQDKEVAASEEESSEVVASEEDGEGKEALEANAEVTEGEEQSEAPIEEPKLTAKEFQELEAHRLQLENDRKAFTEERQRIEQEFTEKHAEKLKLHDEFDAFVADLEVSDPDLHSLLKGAFNQYAKQYNNPVVSSLRNEMSTIKAELDSFKNKATAEVTLTQLDGERKKLSDGLGKDAEAMGVKIDSSKVDEFWAKNPGLSYEQAALAVYGPSLIKASASKAKVEAVQKKVQSRPAVQTAGSVSKTSQKASAPDFSKMNAEERVHYFARELRGA